MTEFKPLTFGSRSNRSPSHNYYKFFKWAILGLFLFIFILIKQTAHILRQINVKISIQYMLLGFKPTTFNVSLLPLPLDH